MLFAHGLLAPPLAEESFFAIPEGTEMVIPAEVRAYNNSPQTSPANTIATTPVTGLDFTQSRTIYLPVRPTNAWDVGLDAKLTSAMSLGDVGVVTFMARARSLPGQADSTAKGEGVVFLQENIAPSYPKRATMSFACGPEWKQMILPFQLDGDLAEGASSFSMHLGAASQILEIGPVRVINYQKKYAFKNLPHTRTTYIGRNLDAPWRKEAISRIEQYRTALLTVNVEDSTGRPMRGAEVEIRQLRNAFGFGSAVTAKWLTASGPDAERYRQIVDECFSRVVLENDLKMECWEYSLENEVGSPFRWENTLNACTWLESKQIPIRGHFLSWAPWEPWSEKLRSDPAAIKDRILRHITRITESVGNRVFEWDAINHLAGWDKNIDEVTGTGFYSEIMKACRAATKLPLWVNEDQVFRPGRQQEDYYKRIQEILASGQTIDGIGNQAHFDASFLPSPDEMLASSDRFAKLVPALQITEFDVMVNGDEQLEADYLRDCLIVCYSHPAYTGFLTWGFWENAHWRPQAAFWRKDWTEKPSAAAWKSLVNHAWATRASGLTGKSGDLTLRAHLGTYQVTVTSEKGEKMTKQVVLSKTSPPLRLVMK